MTTVVARSNERYRLATKTENRVNQNPRQLNVEGNRVRFSKMAPLF